MILRYVFAFIGLIFVVNLAGSPLTRAAPAKQKTHTYTRNQKPSPYGAHIPRFSRDRSHPLAEELIRWRPTRLLRERVKSNWSPTLNNQTLIADLQALGGITGSSHLLLVGNGSFPMYLRLKSMFRKTSFSDQIAFLPLSRPMTQSLTLHRHIHPYYDFLEIDKRPGNLVVMDSASNTEANQTTSIQVAQSIRRYLLDKGLTPKDIIDRVFSYAVLEGPAIEESYETMDQVRLKYLRIPISDFVSTVPISRLPLLISPVSWDATQLNHDYHNVPNWAGKYIEIDERGFPYGNEDLDLDTRLERAAIFRLILSETRKIANDDNEITEGIHAIANELSLKD